MINGSHIVIDSQDPEADRAFFREVLQLPCVDAGHSWLIFSLPPAEVAFHPSAENGQHQLYLMCDDLTTTIEDLEAHGVPTDAPHEESWGVVTSIHLPGGGRLAVYQPKHPRSISGRGSS